MASFSSETHTPAEWEAQRETIIKLYTIDNVDLKDLPRIMEDDYGFKARQVNILTFYLVMLCMLTR
jgi:Clr5 domain